MHAIGERRPGQLDDALIALGEIALIDGEGEMAGAQQAGNGGVARGRQARRIELGIAAQRSAAADIGDHQAHRPVAGGLQGEDALVFQGAGQQGRQPQHLGQEPGDRGGIVVAMQDLVGQRAQPRQTAPEALRFDLERQDQVVVDIHAGGTIA